MLDRRAEKPGFASTQRARKAAEGQDGAWNSCESRYGGERFEGFSSLGEARKMSDNCAVGLLEPLTCS